MFLLLKKRKGTIDTQAYKQRKDGPPVHKMFIDESFRLSSRQHPTLARGVIAVGNNFP